MPPHAAHFPLYAPHFQFTLFPPDGAYPVLVVADAFLVCETRTLTLVSRHYYRRPDLNHSAIRVFVTDAGAGAPHYLFLQGPGDAVYLPALWGHAVLNLADSVGVSLE